MKSTEFQSTLRSVGLSQRKLAGRLGVAVTTVNRWATGHVVVPRYAEAYLELYAERIEIARKLSL